MTLDVLVRELRRVPFTPFLLRTADGQIHSVDQPTFVSRSPGGEKIAFFTPDSRPVIAELQNVVLVAAGEGGTHDGSR